MEPKRSPPQGVGIAVALGAEWFVTALTAQDSEDVPQRIEALQEQVSDLARQQHAFEQQHANDGKNVVTSGATKGSFKLPGSDTSVTLGGYVKLDAVFSNPSAGVCSTADLLLQPGAIPRSGASRGGLRVLRVCAPGARSRRWPRASWTATASEQDSVRCSSSRFGRCPRACLAR